MAQGFRCSKETSLYVYRQDVAADTAILGANVRTFVKGGSNPFTGGAWSRLPHTASVELSPDVTESTRVRTSDTGGLKVKTCSDTVSYSCDVTSYLDPADWLWAYLLTDPTNPGSAENYLRWYSLCPNRGNAAGDTPDFDGATLFLGRVTPGGLTSDNDSEDPESTDWSISITYGPIFPDATWAVNQNVPLRNIA